VNWTAILKNGNIPEPVGRPEVIEAIKKSPYVKRKGKAKVKPARSKKPKR
jgi:ATP sulfurylase